VFVRIVNSSIVDTLVHVMPLVTMSIVLALCFADCVHTAVSVASTAYKLTFATVSLCVQPQLMLHMFSDTALQR
jgi:hypothetical protein